MKSRNNLKALGTGFGDKPASKDGKPKGEGKAKSPKGVASGMTPSGKPVVLHEALRLSHGAGMAHVMAKMRMDMEKDGLGLLEHQERIVARAIATTIVACVADTMLIAKEMAVEYGLYGAPDNVLDEIAERMGISVLMDEIVEAMKKEGRKIGLGEPDVGSDDGDNDEDGPESDGPVVGEPTV